MWATAIGIIWTVIKSFFTKDPEVTQLKSEIKDIRAQAIHNQKTAPSINTAIDRLPE